MGGFGWGWSAPSDAREEDIKGTDDVVPLVFERTDTRPQRGLRDTSDLGRQHEQGVAVAPEQWSQAFDELAPCRVGARERNYGASL